MAAASVNLIIEPKFTKRQSLGLRVRRFGLSLCGTNSFLCRKVCVNLVGSLICVVLKHRMQPLSVTLRLCVHAIAIFAALLALGTLIVLPQSQMRGHAAVFIHSDERPDQLALTIMSRPEVKDCPPAISSYSEAQRQSWSRKILWRSAIGNEASTMSFSSRSDEARHRAQTLKLDVSISKAGRQVPGGPDPLHHSSEPSAP
ncbi:hypothetical protein KP509_04G023800 [Ceratopteris richardii]|uniref:Uncharacterized protein n=1 Tax=Ceratopteris richardii TaxID=49495 RepID=A0A8T2UYS9_CERRI|nr:hypothetical protein KP509_04G023800 [Ceratopteris richardii]